MYETIISWLTSALSAVFGWFTTFFGSIGNGEFLGLFIAMFVVFMAVKFLIIPLTGSSMGVFSDFFSGGSDSVKKNSYSVPTDRVYRRLLTGNVSNKKSSGKSGRNSK